MNPGSPPNSGARGAMLAFVVLVGEACDDMEAAERTRDPRTPWPPEVIDARQRLTAGCRVVLGALGAHTPEQVRELSRALGVSPERDA